MPDIRIKGEFKSLIPSLTDEEYKGLERSIVQEGCRDSIITWDNYIIDGHNRYEICKKNNIAFEVLEKDNFQSEADVKLCMIENQFGRRNLPIETRMKLAYRFKEIEAEKAKDRQLSCLKQFAEEFPDMEDPETDLEVELFAKTLPVSKPVYTRQTEDGKIDGVDKGRSLDAVAKRAGVSHMTAFQYDAIQRKGTEEQKAEFAIQIEKLEQIKAKERQRQLSNLKQFQDQKPQEERDLPVVSELTPPEKEEKSLAKAAKSVGLGYGTVYKTKQILEKAPEDLLEKVKSGNVAINRVFSQIQRNESLKSTKLQNDQQLKIAG